LVAEGGLEPPTSGL